MSNTGGPAFPTDNYAAIVPISTGYSEGMTLRDFFAAKAMQGLMGREWSHLKVADAELFAVWAKGSYFAADAMLVAREQK